MFEKMWAWIQKNKLLAAIISFVAIYFIATYLPSILQPDKKAFMLPFIGWALPGALTAGGILTGFVPLIIIGILLLIPALGIVNFIFFTDKTIYIIIGIIVLLFIMKSKRN